MFPVLPENFDTVLLFINVSTQWRTSFSGVVGLDYTAIESMLRMTRQKITPALFKNIQIMEKAVLRTMAERES